MNVPAPLLAFLILAAVGVALAKIVVSAAFHIDARLYGVLETDPGQSVGHLDRSGSDARRPPPNIAFGALLGKPRPLLRSKPVCHFGATAFR